MPTRIIRGEINSSESLSRVSLEAELAFRALLLAVDDYGRFDGRSCALKAALFPMRAEMSPERVTAVIAELQSEGCVRLYAHDGRPYLHLPSWEKHRGKGRRAASSKYPDPHYDPGDPRKSEEVVGDPPVGRWTMDDGRGTLVVSPKASTAPWALECADVMIELLQPVPGARIPKGARDRWAKEFVRLRKEAPEFENDDIIHPHRAIETAIRWALGPENLGCEYEVVIRSGRSLREKWSRLVAAAQRARRNGKPREDLQAWMDSET